MTYFFLMKSLSVQTFSKKCLLISLLKPRMFRSKMHVHVLYMHMSLYLVGWELIFINYSELLSQCTNRMHFKLI